MKSASYKLVYNRKGIELKPSQKALIQIEIYLSGERRYISTGLYITKEQWNIRERKVQKHSSSMDLNLFMQNKINDLQNYEYSIRNQGQDFDLRSFDSYIQGFDRENFIEFMEREIASRADITPGTKEHHETLLKKLKEFKKIKYFKDLTYTNINDLDNWFILSGLKKSTIYNQHKIIKVYINRAISSPSKYLELQNNPYLKFKTKRAKNFDRKYLTAEELKKISDKDFGKSSIAIVRDLFLFTCYTGLAYAEAYRLTQDNIINESGEKWIKIRRKKTVEESVIMLLPKALEIIEKYKGFKKGRLLPYLTNQRMNSYLKAIAEICEVKKELTTHVARHTFATTVTLMNGVSLEVLQNMLGHASIKTTQVYGKIVKERMKKEMTELREKIK